MKKPRERRGEEEEEDEDFYKSENGVQSVGFRRFMAYIEGIQVFKRSMKNSSFFLNAESDNLK